MDARRHPEGMNPADQASELELIAQARAGNAEAWGELYRRVRSRDFPILQTSDAHS